MKQTLKIIFIVIVTFWNISLGQEAGYVVSLTGYTMTPIGSLANRFVSSTGGSFSIIESSLNNPQWGGSFEYGKFSKPNYSTQTITRKLLIGNTERQYSANLLPVGMKLEFGGASVNMQYTFFTSPLVDVNTRFGFGFYYWTYTRAQYFDSVKVDTGGTKPLLIDNVKVPELTQRDWSGAFDGGLEANLMSFSPLILSAGVRYKIILAELWPSLALDMENVSGMQMVQLTIGIKYKF